MIPLLAALVAVLPAAGPVCPVDPCARRSHAVASDTVPGLFDGVGEGRHARLRFFFEVTFMKIDIAWIEAYLDPAAASTVERTVATGDYSKGRARALEMALLEGDPMLLRMELARSGGAGRFIGATRDNLEAAVECRGMGTGDFRRNVACRGRTARPR